jgi:hypothetical protein
MFLEMLIAQTHCSSVTHLLHTQRAAGVRDPAENLHILLPALRVLGSLAHPVQGPDRINGVEKAS